MDLNTTPNPLSQIPSNAPLTKTYKHKEYFYLAIAVILVCAGILWWQLDKYASDFNFGQNIQNNPTSTPLNQDISDIQSDLNNIDAGNLDSEFKDIDNELNKL